LITLLHCYYYYYRAVHLEVNSCERGRQAKRLAPGVRSSLQCWLVGGGLHPSPSSRTLSRSLGLSGFELQPLGPHSSVSCLASSKNSRSVIGCVVYYSKSYRSNVLFPDSILICEVLIIMTLHATDFCLIFLTDWCISVVSLPLLNFIIT